MMINADHLKRGVVYGFQPNGRFASTRFAETGNIYCFRRSTRAALRNAANDEDELEAIRGAHTGLNRVESLVLFHTTEDTEGMWYALKRRLRHVPFARPDRAGGITPKWIRQLHELGENWFCSDLGPGAFAQWLAGPVESGAVVFDDYPVQPAGDELLIGPVSSQFATRAVLDLIEARRPPSIEGFEQPGEQPPPRRRLQPAVN